MPTLPRIEPRGEVPSLELPSPGPQSFGAGFGKGLEQFGETLMRLQDGADHAQATKLIGDAKARFDQTIQESYDQINDPAEFNKTATDNVTAIHQQTLDAATNSRVQKLVSDNLSNDLIIAQTKIKHATFQKTKDVALADADLSFDQLSKTAAQATDPDERTKSYQDYGNLIGFMKGHGFYDAKTAQDKLINFNRQMLTNYGDGLINTGSFDRYFEEQKKGTFSTLTQADQLVLDRKADIALRRSASMSKDLKKAQIDDAVDSVASRIEDGEKANIVWDDLSGQLKQKGLYGVEARQRFDQLVNAFRSKKGEDSPEYNALLDGFEQDRAKFANGIPDRGTVAKWMKEVDGADLGIEAQRKIRQELNNWNLRRAQFEQTQATKEKSSDIKSGQNVLKEAILIPPRDPSHPTWDEMQAQKNQSKLYNEHNAAAMAEGDRTRDYFGAFKKRADQIKAAQGEAKQKKDALQSLSPAAKVTLDEFQKMKGGK